MLQGVQPFNGFTTQDLIQNIKNTYQNLPFEVEISNDSKNLINQLLEIDPLKRIDWNGVLKHPVF